MDNAHSQTDKRIEKMEKRLEAIYRRADKEIKAKWEEYMQNVEKRSKSLLQAIEEASTPEERAKAEEKYKKFLKNATLQNQKYKDMVAQTTENILHVNETAVAYVNGELPPIYALNYNYVSADLNSQIKDYSFSLTDANTVKNLATSDKTLLPYKTVDGKKDVRWNTKKINAEVLQGILQGESIPKIAARLGNVQEMNKQSSIRNARTMATSAENKGRMDMLKNAEDSGIIVQKTWISTHDSRTREWHSELDGQTVDRDEPFVNSLGEIMYPGDPAADPANVYNCRCTLGYKVVGFKSTRG